MEDLLVKRGFETRLTGGGSCVLRREAFSLSTWTLVSIVRICESMEMKTLQSLSRLRWWWLGDTCCVVCASAHIAGHCFPSDHHDFCGVGSLETFRVSF